MVREEIAGLRLVRLRGPGGRAAVGVVAGDEVGVLEAEDAVATLQDGELPVPTERVALVDARTCIPVEPWRLLAPLVAPETWAAGVTYERSRQAHVHESAAAAVYDRVYDAERPEIHRHRHCSARRRRARARPFRRDHDLRHRNAA
jgi:2-dehydro-3-deoxy-D-arabinonate dehydratase